MIYTLMLKGDADTIRWSLDQEAILGYIHCNKLTEEEWNIIPVTEEQFDKLEEKFNMEQVYLFRDGIYITEDEEEMYSQQIDVDITALIYAMNNVVERLSFLRGDDVKAAIKTLNKLIHEPDVPEGLNRWVDEYEDLEAYFVLTEKIKLNKYLNLLRYGDKSKSKRRKKKK